MKQPITLAFALAFLPSLNANAQEPAETTVEKSKLDFGDASSATLTTKAWESFEAKKYDDAIEFAKKCIKLYEKDALVMQKSLKKPVPVTNKDAVAEQWALNDVGTCYFILGQSLEQQ